MEDEDENDTRLKWIILIIIITSIISFVLYFVGKYIILPWVIDYFNSEVFGLWR